MTSLNAFLTYLTDANAPVDSHLVVIGLWASGILFSASLVALIVFYLWWKKDSSLRQLVYGITGLARIASLLMLVVLYLRYQALPPFEYRIWAVLVLLGTFAWLIFLFWRYKTRLPAFEQQAVVKDSYAKYLPTPKTKKRR